ncbi:patatin-like phospholipase family protein [Rhodopseudomonas palustris]|uniref:Patatin-like phospholipase domain n=1 Tax=Rhodopseudomonas palustris (strain ATCC BAA-98 / CGA009) TaxID=258594 RepID=Q6N577_RHOPA|nr:patatin-like phospholipase family protein [Rhodopseudomonas palustris]OPF93689.1 patatin [Rhodopseudomonas palustris]PPQ45197.1 patatin [Rhodopseudomonas palustris]RJF66406.1 patatin-like phospholipase family protein [Rhodopseudomonas palustris]WAB76014.1 patatin-like phospholipase family protein [Rhodopseudomonas palustris]WCL93270.1 patatin-like phospholipase family protein [Rhodopseudomonas palustris CGA009]
MKPWRDRLLSAAAACLVLAGCASVYNTPVNVPLEGVVADKVASDIGTRSEDAIIGLSFSGGGTRAAAFSFGVLSEMERVPLHGARSAMLDRVGFVSGVSGGSVTAAYFGLKGRAALSDFRERFLLRNAEEGLQTTLSLNTIGKAFTGGINDSVGFTRWLDAHLFEGATFAQLRAGDRPTVWINASDIYNRVPFVFTSTSFSAICSDLDAYPLSNAVAASAAVPLAFAPAVVQAFPGACNTPLPRWVRRAATAEGNSSPMLSSYAKAVLRYREGAVPFIKLLDGGLVDNYGVSALTIARESSETPYGPLTPQQAVKLRRLMMLVVDAKTGISGNWVDTVEGPSGVELLKAAVDTTIDASVGASYTAFDRTISDWREKLVRWRCGLSAADRARYGAGPGWDCRDLRFFVGRLAFDQLEAQRAASLERIATRFVLPPQQVDELISAGRDVLRQNPVFRAFAASL